LLALLLTFYLPMHVAAIAALVLFFVPDLFLAVVIARRRGEIERALPQAIDLMVLCVDAGLGLDATLQRIASEQSGLSSALNEELTILSREILFGIDREKTHRCG
jgi:tight adherence protein C